MSFYKKEEEKKPNEYFRSLLNNDAKAIKAFEKYFGSIDNPSPDGLTILTTVALKKQAPNPRD